MSTGGADMKKSIVSILMIIICIFVAGCDKTASIDFPFEVSNVENIEMFRFTTPANAEKKVITKQEDIEAVYKLLERISLKDKSTEPVAGGSVTSFRFNISDGTIYEVIYSSEAVKSGRIKTTGSEKDYFTSADIGGSWSNYDYKILNVSEDELPTLYKK